MKITVTLTPRGKRSKKIVIADDIIPTARIRTLWEIEKMFNDLLRPNLQLRIDVE
jgi:hypothetical protein